MQFRRILRLIVALLLYSTAAAAQQTRELSLDEAVALALASDEAAAAARAVLERADATVRRVESQRRPQLDGSASYSRALRSQFDGVGGGGDTPPVPPECQGTFEPDSNLPLEERVRLLEQRLACPSASPFSGFNVSDLGFGAPNTWNAGLSFAWPFYSGGRVPAQVRAAEALRDAARSSLASAEANVRLQVTAAYFDSALAAELLRISELSLETSDEMLRITSLRAEAGTQAEFDVLQARVARDNQRPVLIRRATQRDLAFDRLRTLLDLPRDQTLTLTTPIAPATAGESPVAGPPAEVAEQADATAAAERDAATAASERAPVAQAQARVSAAEESLRAARAQRRPSIVATSQYGVVSYAEDFLPETFRDNWSVGAALQIPIFTGGRIEAEIDSARADLAEAQAQSEQIEEATWLDSSSALAELRAARATWEATQGTVQEAERGYSLAQLRYREGVSIQLEIENARLLLEQARVNRAQAARDLRIAQTRVALLPLLPLSGTTVAMPAVPVTVQAPQQRVSSPSTTSFGGRP